MKNESLFELSDLLGSDGFFRDDADFSVEFPGPKTWIIEIKIVDFGDILAKPMNPPTSKSLLI
jgi:hypothetical protein